MIATRWARSVRAARRSRDVPRLPWRLDQQCRCAPVKIRVGAANAHTSAAAAPTPISVAATHKAKLICRGVISNSRTTHILPREKRSPGMIGVAAVQHLQLVPLPSAVVVDDPNGMARGNQRDRQAAARDG